VKKDEMEIKVPFTECGDMIILQSVEDIVTISDKRHISGNVLKSFAGFMHCIT
jgi:hypothetical protein